MSHFLLSEWNLLTKNITMRAQIHQQYYYSTKGQLISECLFDVLSFPKKTTKNLTNFCPRKWSNHKVKAQYNDFDTNYVQIMLNITRRYLYFVDLTTFYILGQKSVKFFVVFFGKFKIVKKTF